MDKNVLVFGGGTGMSCLLKGLKQFPVNITSVVSVCDDGWSTGILRDEFDMLAVGEMEDGSLVEGEHHITESNKTIKRVFYKEPPVIKDELIKKIEEADLIAFSMGSLYTSLLPCLACEEIIDAIDRSNAPIIYTCNLFTQPGETEKFTVSDHVNVINSYLGNKKVNIVIANDGKIDETLAHKYLTTEQKDIVVLDEDKLDEVVDKVIKDDLVIIEDGVFRHDYITLGSHIFSEIIRMNKHVKKKIK